MVHCVPTSRGESTQDPPPGGVAHPHGSWVHLAAAVGSVAAFASLCANSYPLESEIHKVGGVPVGHLRMHG